MTKANVKYQQLLNVTSKQAAILGVFFNKKVDDVERGGGNNTNNVLKM